jgi:RHS repeat-associated protein
MSPLGGNTRLRIRPSTSTATSVGNDLLLSMMDDQSGGDFTSYGAGETEMWHHNSDPMFSIPFAGTWKAAAASAGTETMSENNNSTTFGDYQFIAIKPSGTTTVSAIPTSLSNVYTYGGTGYANPDSVTQIANGLSTTTFTYDNNGNLAQKTVDGTTTTYVWDYANRLIALGVGGATTTYGYDAFGQRVFQIGTTTTTLYPFKWYSVASSTGTGAKYATTTEYVFNGDSFVSTTDQQTASGAATGTAQTRYIHPDHLGSTNVVTNASGTVVQTLDYYPYGATRITTSIGGADSARKYIGQFADQSNLNYLNARYYDGSRGQFLSEDPVFLQLGTPGQAKQISQQTQSQILADPQLLNAYSYARGNPISIEDPLGLAAKLFEGNPIVTGLEYYDYYDLGKQYINLATTGYSGLTDNEKAQINFGTVVTGVGAFPQKFIQKSEAAFLTVGGTVLQAIDAYCSSNICQNLKDSQNVTPQAIFAGLPKPNIELTYSGVKCNYSNGPPSYTPGGSGRPAVSQSMPAGTGSGTRGGGGGGSASSNLVGLYQSLVSILSALVNARKALISYNK